MAATTSTAGRARLPSEYTPVLVIRACYYMPVFVLQFWIHMRTLCKTSVRNWVLTLARQS